MKITPAPILVIDDDPPHLDYVTTLLQRNGLRAEGETSPRTALDRLSRALFGAVVFDVVMPDLDGIDLVRAIRGLDPRIPLIAMTGIEPSMYPAIRELLHVLGTKTVLRKPFEPERLLDELRPLGFLSDPPAGSAAFTARTRGL